VHDRVRDPVTRDEPARVLLEVLRVDAEDDDAAVAVAAPSALEERGLVLTRTAPRGPEVEHDDIPAQRGEREASVAVEPRQRESGRRRGFAGVHPVVERPPFLGLDDLQAEQDDEADDHRHGGRLQDELEAAGHSATPSLARRLPMTATVRRRR
jgi:hypothetical protein